MGKFGNADNKGKRCILYQGDELVHKRGDHVAQSLGEDDVDHCLPVLEPGGYGRFHLPSGNPLNSGTNYLRHIGRGENRQAEDYRSGLRETLAEDGREEKIHPEDYHEQRYAADGINDQHRRQAEPLFPRNTQQAQDESAKKGEDAGGSCEIEGKPDAAQRAFRPAAYHEVNKIVGDYLKIGEKTHVKPPCESAGPVRYTGLQGR